MWENPKSNLSNVARASQVSAEAALVCCVTGLEKAFRYFQYSYSSPLPAKRSLVRLFGNRMPFGVPKKSKGVVLEGASRRQSFMLVYEVL